MNKAGGEGSPALSGVKLFIGTPSRGDCSIHYARSLAQTVGLLTKAGIDVECHQVVLSCFVDMIRNTLVSEFLKTDFTHLMMIDDDMGWNAESVLNMLAHDVEFIAGVGPKKVDSGDEFCCHINVNADETPMVKDGMISASHVGGAFVLLKREAIERMIKAYPEMVCRAVDLKHGYRFFETQYSENKFQSEDYLFCDRFTAAGGEIWIYPDVEFSHTGRKDYQGNYHKFLMGMPKEDSAKTAKASVVIVAYKGREALQKCLHSVAANTPGAEVVIVNNGPEPLNVDVTPAMKIIEGHGNIGFAAGCNLGAKATTGDNLIFLNPDTIVYPGWADTLASHLLEGVGAVGPLSNFVAGAQNWLCYAHSARFIGDSPDYAKAAKAIAGSKIHKGLEVKLLIGFCLMVPRKVWETVGEFDPAFILGCDDLDYSLRIRESGLKLMIAPDVFVYHEGHVSFYESGSPAMLMNKVSEAAMRAKLRKAYGDKVPDSVELWGCEIFQTTEDLYPVSDELTVIGKMDLISEGHA